MELSTWVIFSLFIVYLLYATAEVASQLLSKHKVQIILDNMRQRSALSRRLLPDNHGRLRYTLSMGRMLFVVALTAALFTLLAQRPLVLTGAAVLSLIAVLYLPVVLAVRNPEAVIKVLLPVLRFANILLLPLTLPPHLLFNNYKSQHRRKIAESVDEELEAQQIEAYFDAAEEEGLFEPDEAELMRQVVEFSDTIVKEVMTPRVDMECVDCTTSLVDFMSIVAEHKFSRFPVIESMIDKVVGIAHVKALLGLPPHELKEKTVTDILSPPHFVPESKKVSSLLRDLQGAKQQMAIVVDEYGGTAGLITLEDILEEIVGEIEDEHGPETEREAIVTQPDGSLVVMGHVDVDEVEKILGMELDDESYETVSGLALSHLKHIPKPGEHFVTRGVKVEILEADEKSILKLQISRTSGDA